MTKDSRFSSWLKWLIVGAVFVMVVLAFAAIAWGRAQRTASAPAVLEEVYQQGNGRFTVGAYSFSVEGRSYRGEDAGPSLRRGERIWSSDDLEGMQVCYDPDRAGEEFELTPPHYQCGDPDIFTSDGGW